LKATKSSELLSYHFRVYGALDVIDEKAGMLSTKSAFFDKDSSNRYLGLLYPIDDHYVYGYVTNTNVKFILVQEVHSTVMDASGSSTGMQIDAKVRKTFQALHDAYVRLLSSPFYVSNTPINPSDSASAKKFDEVVDSLLEYQK
uniref:Trafficking protein particle complex subunit n=1 Tax=Schistocephalus solidus TaxID=70667 RepID=A0A183SZQ3_SCHSO